MKKSIIIFALFLMSCMTFAQDVVDPPKKESKLAIAVDVVYPYLWRGIKYYGDRIAFQPYLSYAFTDKLTVGVWATTNFSDGRKAYNEFDWNISYQISPVVKVMLSDYYWPATKKNIDWSRSSYFDYSDGSVQSLDLSVLLDFTEKGVPLDFQWNTFLAGNDYKDVLDENDEVVDRKKAYSSYAEIGYKYNIKAVDVEARAFVGAAVINGGYYGADANGKSGFSFSNVGVSLTKAIKISKNYDLPVFIRYSNNDYGVQQFDDEGNLTKTIRNTFSAGITFKIM